MTIHKYIKNYCDLFNDIKNIEKLRSKIRRYKKNSSKKILLFGNGGSSSICSHIATDMVKINGIRSHSFNDHNLITCFGNDYGFENWITNALKNFCDKSDLVILISSSGNSKNMINAAKYCKKNRIDFFSLTGFKKNNKLSKVSKNTIWVDSNKYNYVESAHFQILAYIVDTI